MLRSPPSHHPQFSIQQSSVAIQIVQFMDSSLFIFVIPPFPLFFAFHSSSCEKSCGEFFLVDRWKAGSFGAIKRLDFGSVNQAVSVLLVITHPIVLRRRRKLKNDLRVIKAQSQLISPPPRRRPTSSSLPRAAQTFDSSVRPYQMSVAGLWQRDPLRFLSSETRWEH